MTNGHSRALEEPEDQVEYQTLTENMRRSSYAESSSSESYNTPLLAQEPHRQIDVNLAKNPAVHRDAGPLQFALTVLRSCPLYDTIAILIFLLQIPPTCLSIIQLLYASLTFVPPSVSATSGLSLTDIFEGTIATPSIATIVVVDFFVLLIWLFLWAPLQDIALDLAQTVMALTLGGGTSGRSASTNNVLVCLGIVGISHIARTGGIRQTGLNQILTTSSGGFLGSPDPDDPLEALLPRTTKRSAPGWARSMLAIHVLTQGLVRFIRDWYVRREKRDVATPLGDPEAAKGPGHVETSTDASTLVSPAIDPDSSSGVGAMTIPAKKRSKRQSALVRIRQPLWAALASTKIVMVKEYESSHAAAESAGANATDVNNLGNAPFSTEADKIWLSYVGSDEVFFATSQFSSYATAASSEKNSAAGIDYSKPFYVKVNGTHWQPTRITPGDQGNNAQPRSWSGEILGLAAMSNYEITFVSTTSDRVIFTTSVQTLQPPVLAAIPPSTAVQGRPGSPTTTLKASIATSEVKLVEERSRLKRDRKDQRSKLNSLRREIEKVANIISTAGSNDDRLRQKVQQSNLHMKQAEDALALMEDDVEAPSGSVVATWKSQKQQRKHAQLEFSEKQNAYQTAKTAAEQALSSLSAELASLQQKRERMTSRIAKLASEHERITDANARGMDQAAQRMSREADRQRSEALYLERLNGSSAQVSEAMASLRDLYAAIENAQAYETYIAQQNQHKTSTGPPTSLANSSLNAGAYAEGSATPSSVYAWYTPMPAQGSFASPIMKSATFPLSSGSTAAMTPWHTPALGHHELGPSNGLCNGSPTTHSLGAAFHASQSTSQGLPSGLQRRGRSSSMLSDVSGFTQDSHDGILPIGQGQAHAQIAASSDTIYGRAENSPWDYAGSGNSMSRVFGPASTAADAPLSVLSPSNRRTGPGNGSGSGSGSGSGHGSIGSIGDSRGGTHAK